MAAGIQIQQMQQAIQEEYKRFQEYQAELQKLIPPKGQYLSQIEENEAVKKELDLLEEDARVYKQIGPVLVQQDLDQARSNVQKRLEFINNELENVNNKTAAIEEKRDTSKDKLLKLQQVMEETMKQLQAQQEDKQ